MGGMVIKNKILLSLLAVLPFSIWFGLTIEYKPYLEALVFIGMYACLSRETAQRSLKTVLMCGCAMAVYGILQALGFESAFISNFNNANALATPGCSVGSTVGNPTFLGAVLAMLVPLSIREGFKDKRYWIVTVVMITAVLLTKSDMAIGSMLVSLAIIPMLTTKKGVIVAGVCLLLGVSGTLMSLDTIKDRSSGRFTQWETIVKTMNKGVQLRNDKLDKTVWKKYSLFGLGGGAYGKLFPNKILKENFNTCHNEYLQTYVEFGIVALVLLIAFIVSVILGRGDVFAKASLICICLNALGLFVWQLGLTRILTVYVLCLCKNRFPGGYVSDSLYYRV